MKAKFFNRELSWIEFNQRVMNEAFREELPLLERFKFLSITSSNFDEFFMVRVAGIKRTILNKARYNCPSGISAHELFQQISQTTHELIDKQYRALNDDILPELKKSGIEFCNAQELRKSEILSLQHHFQNEIFPVLTPLKAVSNRATHNFGNLELHAAFLLEGNEQQHLAVVPVPASLKRLCILEN